jgi:site-specific DNA-methyltransferase (adenine-specific)
MSPWGFAGYNPVLFYGKDPRDGKGQSSVMTTLTGRPSDDRHPCAKPLGAMVWMVMKASLEGEMVLDPFMGSGTTGVACARLGRKFIGIEIEERYFDIACKRISREYEQLKLFPPEEKREAVQMELGDA